MKYPSMPDQGIGTIPTAPTTVSSKDYQTLLKAFWALHGALVDIFMTDAFKTMDEVIEAAKVSGLAHIEQLQDIERKYNNLIKDLKSSCSRELVD